ncbi:MAG: alanine--tRNA ligase [Defluviitaleaceae bacterium]|nr:alanine--tRNA ligase [Defluviitaleaceae bacterium]MCL2836266.1 alanine--tRNA ligase [Defluviitaleaceae bacterium]
MKSLGLNELREKYQKFFEQKGHMRVHSASLVPQSDKSLLLISSGMAPLKPYFTGQEQPPSPRLVSCQKCIRTNDIENVGVTSRHCTFFEMLGNFSFGDYFKKESIAWAWEFVTQVLEIPEERLFPSVYLEDDEALSIWRDKIGVPENRIAKLGKEHNFWEIGTGPCGPSSEIYFDRGEGSAECDNDKCGPGCECDRFIEIWNLVFTQFNKNEDGSYTPLEKKNIDTGMGLERTSLVLQNVGSVHDLDTMKAIRDAVCAETNVEYGKSPAADKSVRIITDHSRAITFMLADGILPSNEGRGYVLRKLLRRAALHGKLLGFDGEGFLTRISGVARKQFEAAYPELVDRADFIHKMIDTEERRFNERLDSGVDVLKRFLSGAGGKLTPAKLGIQAFTMYDTFGFPPELTQELLISEGLQTEIGMDAFNAEMEKQRERARGSRGETNYMGAEETALNRLSADMETEFLGYAQYKVEGAEILAVIENDCLSGIAREGADIIIVPDKTPFYAESGGQKGDSGELRTETGIVRIYDCKRSGGKYAHFGTVASGEIKTGQKAELALDTEKRINTARNHTATHLLHKALKEILGTHVEQAGSLVSPDRLRFDFSHFQPLTAEELLKVEDTVNSRVLSGLCAGVTETTPDKAREMGAVALFGEKYGDSVRVVDLGGYSMELCGGTHVANTAETGMFKILSETGIAAGVRRIEAVTGLNALSYYREVEDNVKKAAARLKTSPENLGARIEAVLAERNELQKELNKYKKDASAGIADDLLAAKKVVGKISVAAGEIGFEDAPDAESRRELADKLRGKLGGEPGLILLLFKNGDGGASFLAAATDSGVKSGVHCGNIIKDTVKNFGGRGGGKPDMAQGGIPAGTDLNEVLSKAMSVIVP